eukprot:3318160-Rhodomonas_salina.1
MAGSQQGADWHRGLGFWYRVSLASNLLVNTRVHCDDLRSAWEATRAEDRRVATLRAAAIHAQKKNREKNLVKGSESEQMDPRKQSLGGA